MLRSNQCDYSNAYFVVKERKTVRGTSDTNKRNKKLPFKNNAPFRSYISKINNTFTDNAEDVDIVMPLYNLIEYSGNYSMIPRDLWNYDRDEVNGDANENDNNNNKINSNKTITSKSSEYKTKIRRSTTNNNNILDTEVVAPLIYLSTFWRSLDLPLINARV